MVISFTNNFVFPRIPKNASTSVAAHFIENACHPRRDVWTRLAEIDAVDTNFPIEVYHKHNHDWHYVHLTPMEMVDGGILTIDQLRSMKIINIIREPFERQLSLFMFRMKEAGGVKEPYHLKKYFREEFKNGFHETDGSSKFRQYDYGVVDGEHVAECWLYEDFPKQIEKFCLERCIPNWPLRYDKSSNIKQYDMSYYDDATYEAVANYYAKDIELYNKLKEGTK